MNLFFKELPYFFSDQTVDHSLAMVSRKFNRSFLGFKRPQLERKLPIDTLRIIIITIHLHRRLIDPHKSIFLLPTIIKYAKITLMHC